MKQVTPRPEFFPPLPGGAPQPQGIFRAAQTTQTVGQAGACTEGWGLAEEPSYPPKGWSWSPKEIPAQVIHKHVLEIQFLLLLGTKGRCGCWWPRTQGGEDQLPVEEPLHPTESLWVL